MTNNMRIEDNGEVYYQNSLGHWMKIGVDFARPTKEEIEKQKLESAKKLYKLLQFKMDLVTLYQKHNITIEYDYNESLDIEFKDTYEDDYILAEIDNEIARLKRNIGGFE